MYPIISCHIVDLKRQNRLKVGTDKPKLNVKTQSVTDYYVRKRRVEKPRFELAAKCVFRLGRCYIFWQGVPGLWASNWESKDVYVTLALTIGILRSCRLCIIERRSCTRPAMNALNVDRSPA